MAFIRAIARVTSEGLVASTEGTLPDYEVGDLLVVQFVQDGGVNGDVWSTTPSGWDVRVYDANQGVMVYTVSKLATTTNEIPPTVTSSRTETITCIAISIGDVNQTTPIQQVQKATPAAGTTVAFPSITTTQDHALVLYMYGGDNPAFHHTPTTLDIMPFGQWTDLLASNHHYIGYKYKPTAGVVPSYSIQQHINDSGVLSAFQINSSVSSGPAYITTSIKPVSLRGWLTGNTHLGLSTFGPATVLGLSLADATNIGSNPANADDDSPATNAIQSNTLTTDFRGWYENISSTNLTGLLTLYINPVTSKSQIGEHGVIMLVMDSLNNWTAYSLFTKSSLTPVVATYVELAFKLSRLTVLDSSTTPADLTDIVKVGWAQHRDSTTTNNRYTYLRDLWKLDLTVIVGGSQTAPATASLLEKVGLLHYMAELASLRGVGQVVNVYPVQIGDGTTPTYYTSTGVSFEMRRYSTVGTRVGDLDTDVTIYASANDTMDFSNSITQSATKQRFIIHASSSTLATYAFSGATISGYELTWRDGITCRGANLIGCYKITANGGTFDGCVIEDSRDSIALTTSDPSEIKRCDFISGGAGHAIEITTPGTYTFTGNTFTGYGTAGTADAAIYNNSGGAVTLNVTGGGDTPTVKNGAGASTTINNNLSLTLENLVVGSAIRVEKTSDGSLVEFRTAASTTEVFSVSGGFAYTAKVRKGSAAPKYIPWQTNTGTMTANQTIYVSQIADEIAA